MHLEVVGQLRAPRVTRVHGNECVGSVGEHQVRALEGEPIHLGTLRTLDGQDLGGAEGGCVVDFGRGFQLAWDPAGSMVAGWT
jgi:hypothetical protein